MIKKYRKRPVVIEAVIYDGENGEAVADFMRCMEPAIKDGKLIIGTLEGQMEASPGDYIIKGVEGEFYPCKPAIFIKTYEEVEHGRIEIPDPIIGSKKP